MLDKHANAASISIHSNQNLTLSLQKYRMSDGDEHRQLFDLILKMLVYEPSVRITLAEALRHPFFNGVAAHQKLDIFR